MNLNEYSEDLKREEQAILDELICRMNGVLERLELKMKNYVYEANNADISINPDAYLAKILAKRGMKDTAENRKKILQSRDELYHTRECSCY